MRQTSRTIRVSVAAALGLVSATAPSAPSVKSVYKTYSTAGTLTTLTINGSGLCGVPCATAPSVTLGGTALPLTSFTDTVLVATVPLLSVGEYSLGITPSGGTTTSYGWVNDDDKKASGAGAREQPVLQVPPVLKERPVQRALPEQREQLVRLEWVQRAPKAQLAPRVLLVGPWVQPAQQVQWGLPGQQGLRARLV